MGIEMYHPVLKCIGHYLANENSYLMFYCYLLLYGGPLIKKFTKRGKEGGIRLKRSRLISNELYFIMAIQVRKLRFYKKKAEIKNSEVNSFKFPFM